MDMEMAEARMAMPFGPPKSLLEHLLATRRLGVLHSTVSRLLMGSRGYRGEASGPSHIFHGRSCIRLSA